MDWDVWGPPLVAVGVGVGFGAAVAWFASRSGRSGADANPERLAARKEQLMEALREHEADRGKLDEATWTAKREALLKEAADTLRALEVAPSQGDASAAPAGTGSPSAPVAAASGGRRLAWGVGTVAFFALLAGGLAVSTKQRAQGDSMTGGRAAGEDALAAAAAEAQEKLKRDPDDLDALNTLTWYSIRSRDLNAAMQNLEHARQVAPGDPLVLTHLAVLEIQIGMIDKAEASLQQALSVDPTLPRSLIFYGLVKLQKEERAEAAPFLEKVLSGDRADPEERQMAASLLSEAKAPPPQERLLGTVALAEGVSPASGGTLFVIVRRAADGGGPPVAALRLPVASLPMEFTVTDKNMMMGGAWPEQVWVQARVDADGNPSTKGEGDVESAVLGPFTSGASGVMVVLGGTTPAATPTVVGGGATSGSEPAPSATAGARAKGRLTLAAGASVPPGGVLFVMARRQAEGGGPPVAALRLPVSSFPLEFSLTDQDMMMGGTWPEQVWLQARIDADGNPSTKGEGDVSSKVIGPVTSGAADVEIVLGGD